MRRFLLAPVLTLALSSTLVGGALTLSGCNPPPNLSPAGKAAYTATEVIRALDVVRDTAIALNAQVPPIISTAETTKIVNWHESAVKVLQATPTGWKATLQAGLAQLQADLSAATWNRIAPYITLVNTLIAGVS